MPYVIPRPRIRRVLFACIGAAVLMGAIPALADACAVSAPPSPALSLGSTLPLWQPGDALTVRIQTLPARYGGAWSIDDVYVDPYGRG